MGRGIFVGSNCGSDGTRHKNLPEICIGGGAWQKCSRLHHHPQGSHDAQECCVSTEIYLGGLGDKMEDWVERLHQTRMRLRQRFPTVQNLVIHALAREKANSRSSHPDVIAHTNATNAGNKRSFSVVKVDDAILTRRKRHHDMGQYEAMKYFDKEVNKKLTWLVIFDNVKAGEGGAACIISAMP